jgi:hypothetical protein
MHPHRLIVFSVALTFVMFFAHVTSAQVTDRMKATAPEKMMPADKAAKMRECKKRTEQQKIKIEDRSRFMDGSGCHEIFGRLRLRPIGADA